MYHAVGGMGNVGRAGSQSQGQGSANQKSICTRFHSAFDYYILFFFLLWLYFTAILPYFDFVLLQFWWYTWIAFLNILKNL